MNKFCISSLPSLLLSFRGLITMLLLFVSFTGKSDKTVYLLFPARTNCTYVLEVNGFDKGMLDLPIRDKLDRNDRHGEVITHKQCIIPIVTQAEGDFNLYLNRTYTNPLDASILEHVAELSLLLTKEGNYYVEVSGQPSLISGLKLKLISDEKGIKKLNSNKYEMLSPIIISSEQSIDISKEKEKSRKDKIADLKSKKVDSWMNVGRSISNGLNKLNSSQPTNNSNDSNESEEEETIDQNYNNNSKNRLTYSERMKLKKRYDEIIKKIQILYTDISDNHITMTKAASIGNRSIVERLGKWNKSTLHKIHQLKKEAAKIRSEAFEGGYYIRVSDWEHPQAQDRKVTEYSVYD